MRTLVSLRPGLEYSSAHRAAQGSYIGIIGVDDRYTKKRGSNHIPVTDESQELGSSLRIGIPHRAVRTLSLTGHEAMSNAAVTDGQYMAKSLLQPENANFSAARLLQPLQFQ